jgi:hypothetical protein
LNEYLLNAIITFLSDVRNFQWVIYLT